tara:strand:+ start:150 stop:329 length:180 start_codon:yes stop_codon:yes gene_type:complete
MKKINFNFEKFVNDICERESDGKKRVENISEHFEENFARKYNRKYRELWQNRIKYGRKK